MNKETFRISAALKDLIGRELITDEFVAIFELVKNSFDALADEVIIEFVSNRSKQDSKIVIKDNGKGMTYQDLYDKWLFVAYSAKRLGTENNDYRSKINNRIFAGAKGVGRFSCDRLGSSLELLTKSRLDESNAERLVIDWEKFENVDSKEFVDIQIDRETITKDRSIPTGTKLTITKLRDEWSRKRILELKRSLVKLINPNQENDSKNFSIKIVATDELEYDKIKEENSSIAKEYEIVNGQIENKIFETLEIKTSNILVEISEDGKYLETTLQDRGDLIYYTKEKNPYKRLENIKVYLFQLNRAAKYNFATVMGLPSVEYGSVFMYKNGFRVYPYGEEGEDLLLIDRRKQQGYRRFLGTRDIIGRIEIYGQQPQLQETTTRDGGLIKTETYEDLKTFFKEFVLKTLENYVVKIIQWGDPKIDNKTKKEISPALWPSDVKHEILELITGKISNREIIDIQYDDNFLDIIDSKQDKSVDKIIKNVRRVVAKSKDKSLIKEARKIEKALKQTKEDVEIANKKLLVKEEEVAQVNEKLRHIIGQNLFLKSEIGDDTINLESILHHIGLTTSLIKSDIANLVKAINGGNKPEALIEIVQRISRQNEKITSFSRYFKKAAYNIHSNDLKADVVAFFNEYLENVYKLRDDLRSNRELLDVEIINKKNVEFLVGFNPIDIIIVIDNLISNSTKHKSKKVTLIWELQYENQLTLNYFDDGTGIKPSIFDSVFDFGFSTSRRGSGIGLYHVRDLLSKMNASIELLQSNKGASFIITFKK